MLHLHDYKLIHILVLKKKHYYKINLKMKSKKTQKEDNALKLVTRMALPDDRAREQSYCRRHSLTAVAVYHSHN